MRCYLKMTLVTVGVVYGFQLAGCAVSPNDPRSPYYTSVTDHKSSLEGVATNYVVQRSSPISGLQGSLESKLWQHFERWRGTPYAYGGNGKNGIDCSAFVKVTLKDVANLAIPRTTRTQIRVGKPVSRQQLRPGDVVFFQTGPNQMHNGVYLGQGKFMHASKSVGVTVSKLSNTYWNPRYIKSIRVLS